MRAQARASCYCGHLQLPNVFRSCSSRTARPTHFGWSSKQHSASACSSSSSSSSSSRLSCSAVPAGADCAASSDPRKLFILDLDVVIRGFEAVLTVLAWHAAKQLWPEHIVGSPGLFQKEMGRVLPAIHDVSESVLLIRLLADEGVVGSRSRSGRSGPVVGRCVRSSGSRPLLPTEILEHYELIRSTVLLRWSKEGGTSPEQLLERVKGAFQQVLSGCTTHQQEPVPGAAPHHGTEGTSAEPASAAAPSCSMGASSSSSSSSSSSGSRSRSSQAAASPPLASGDAAAMLSAATRGMQSYPSILQAVRGCQHEVMLVSSYPQQVTAAAAEAAGLAVGEGQVQLLPEEGLAQQLQVALQQQGEQQARWQHLRQQQMLLETSWSSKQQQQQQQDDQPHLGCHPEQQQQQQDQPRQSDHSFMVHVVLANPSKIDAVAEILEQAAAGQQVRLPAAGPACADAGMANVGLGSSKAADRPAWSLSTEVSVADWACSSPVLRARAACHPNACLLSEADLAERMGVAELDVVMDGIAWR